MLINRAYKTKIHPTRNQEHYFRNCGAQITAGINAAINLAKASKT